MNAELPGRDEKLVELARANAELSEFAYVASHDLQSPLRKILGFAERLKPHVAEGEGAHCLARLTASAERMSALIDALLEMARVTGPAAAAFAEVCFETLADEAAVELEEDLRGARVERRPLPRVRGDRGQLLRLLENLLSNAVKFRDPQRPLVVKLAARPAAPGFVAFYVEDNGLGVPRDQAHRLFRPLQRLHPGAREGSGLGLAICSKIALRHGGYLSHEPGEPHGSRFVLTLPSPYEERRR